MIHLNILVTKFSSEYKIKNLKIISQYLLKMSY